MAAPHRVTFTYKIVIWRNFIAQGTGKYVILEKVESGFGRWLDAARDAAKTIRLFRSAMPTEELVIYIDYWVSPGSAHSLSHTSHDGVTILWNVIIDDDVPNLMH